MCLYHFDRYVQNIQHIQHNNRFCLFCFALLINIMCVSFYINICKYYIFLIFNHVKPFVTIFFNCPSLSPLYNFCLSVLITLSQSLYSVYSLDVKTLVKNWILYWSNWCIIFWDKLVDLIINSLQPWYHLNTIYKFYPLWM